LLLYAGNKQKEKPSIISTSAMLICSLFMLHGPVTKKEQIIPEKTLRSVKHRRKFLQMATADLLACQINYYSSVGFTISKIFCRNWSPD